MKIPALVGWMLVALGLVTALATWDELRESQSALEDFAHEQTTLANGLSVVVAQRLAQHEDESTKDLMAGLRAIEQPHALRVLLAHEGSPGLLTTDGEPLRSAPIEEAIREQRPSARLSREEAADLGFPARMAVAGLRSVDAGPRGRWTVTVVATAQVVRDRELRARWRLVLGVLVASGLVIVFGGLAMRKQRTELELAHQLAITTLQNERDERLVRADKLATMGALAMGIAHEVSTPLGVILGRAEQLLPKQTDDRARRAVGAIVEQTERIHAVIRGFLALARGRQPALERCDPVALARAAVELVEHRFEQVGVGLTTDIATVLPELTCDARLFEQVLVNLLLNACDACEPGGSVALSVHAERETVTFEVADDGVGISPEAAARATEPFFTTKREGKGSGLGLAIANELVKHHCGRLTLAPRPDRRGTLARVELPLGPPPQDHA